MAWMPFCTYFLVLFVHVLFFVHQSASQALSTDTPVPPLQWLEITSLLSGSGPPGLRDASIGYNPGSNTLILFGGEDNGVAQATTYLLDMSTLTWSPPHPPPNIGGIPPARSAMISGGDFAFNYRQGHVIIGGKASDGKPLDDAWEFDYNNQFWAEINISPGGPGAIWGASGGVDFTATPVTDPNVAGPNNTFYVSGGFSSNNFNPVSDIWLFNISGVLSSNLVSSVFASWTQVNWNADLPLKISQGSAVMPSARVVIDGGCDETNVTGSSCAEQDTYVLDILTSKTVTPQGCPGPREGPVVVPNRCPASSNFMDQAFVISGLMNASLWDDGGGLQNGEVDVLNVNTGSWSRILPAGDPSSSAATVKFPSPRAGAAAFSFSSALVGNVQGPADTIMIGGQDVDGNYLSDVWILRAYNASVSSSGQKWPGFGNGILQSGVDADGTGVAIQFLTSCAMALQPTKTHSVSSPSTSMSQTSQSPSQTSSAGPAQSSTIVPQTFDTTVAHKALSPVSCALLLLLVLVARFVFPRMDLLPFPFIGLLLLAVSAYVTGIVGLVLAFTTITSVSSATHSRRSIGVSSHLKTTHGKMALTFFLTTYILIPAIYITTLYRRKSRPQQLETQRSPTEKTLKQNSSQTVVAAQIGDEKLAGSSSQSQNSAFVSQTVEPRKRTFSSAGNRMLSSWKPERMDRRSSESGMETNSSMEKPRSFEVTNRPTRHRRQSGTYYGGGTPEASTSSPPLPRNLSEVSWLERRRSVNAVGELDYALTQLHQRREGEPLSRNGEIPVRSTHSLVHIRESQVQLPAFLDGVLHILMHTLLLALSAVSLAELWLRAPIAAFIVALIWTCGFYAIILYFSFHGKPQISILSVLLRGFHWQVRQSTQKLLNPISSRPMSGTGLDQSAPGDNRGPYTHHQPLYRVLASPGNEDYLSANHHNPPHGAEADDDDDDDDEDARQQRIEEEMGRRDVSIVTVPKRKLWITNPS